jgi:carbon catabolite-derepressing protein kinase
VASELPARFRFVRILGKGQYAHVVLAMDQSVNEPRALKCIPFSARSLPLPRTANENSESPINAIREPNSGPSTFNSHCAVVPSTATAQELRLINELAALRAVHDVERCVHLHDVVATLDKTYLITSFIGASTTLESHLLAVGALSECDARRLFAPLVRTIGQVHERGWVHHDLSLQNVLVSADGTPHVIDFGLAQPNVASLRSFGATPYFSSPELLLRLEHSGAPVDVWALGVILFAMVCGAMPFPAKSLRELRERVMRRDSEPLAFSPRLSNQLRALISAMLTFEPSARATIDDVLAHEWLAEESPESSSAPSSPQEIF